MCEIDLVHEGVTWFGDRGSATIRVPVEVQAVETSPHAAASEIDRAVPSGTDAPSGEPDLVLDLPVSEDVEIGEFPMDGVHRDTILQLVARSHASVFHLETDERGGPEWHGYRYFVVKSS